MRTLLKKTIAAALLGTTAFAAAPAEATIQTPMSQYWWWDAPTDQGDTSASARTVHAGFWFGGQQLLSDNLGALPANAGLPDHEQVLYYNEDPDVLSNVSLDVIINGMEAGIFGGIKAMQGANANMKFIVPNIIDDELTKDIHVQIVFDYDERWIGDFTAQENGFMMHSLPENFGITSVVAHDAFDLSPYGHMTFTPETGRLDVDGPHPYIGQDMQGTYVLNEFWRINPNPDYEEIILTVPEGIVIHHVLIDTISYTVPEPGTYALLGACTGLISIARRSKLKKIA